MRGLLVAAILATTPGLARAAPKESQAPAPKPKQGHFLSLGLHYGGMRSRDTLRGGWRPLTHGPFVSLRAGETLTPWLDLGLDLGLGMGVGRDSLRLARLTAHARWYPLQHWFVHTGVGLGASGGADPEDADFQRGRYGELYVVGLGTNRFVTRKTKSGGFALSPIIEYQVGPDPVFTTMALWFGVELTWWSGLSRDKLELPPDRAYERKKRRR